jgi:hypothetical protein
MQSLRRRIERLERHADACQEEGVLLVIMESAMTLALDSNRCVEILRESGFVRAGSGISLINLLKIPRGLNPMQLACYLRDKGDEICNRRAMARWDSPVGTKRGDPRTGGPSDCSSRRGTDLPKHDHGE